MEKQKTKKNEVMLLRLAVCLVLLLSVGTSAHRVYGQSGNSTQNNQWTINLGAAGPIGFPNNTFAPFNQISFTANVNYGSVPYANMLVTFKIHGPGGSNNPTNITRIVSTDVSGNAVLSIHLPIDTPNNASPVGTWQASATVQTNQGTIGKSITFTTSWPLTLSSITLSNSQAKNQTIFQQGKIVNLQMQVTNNIQQLQTANITVNVQDVAHKLINQTQINNVQIGASSTNQIQTTFKIPINASIGEAMVNATIYSGTYQNTQIQTGETTYAYFAVTVANSIIPASLGTLFPWLLLIIGLLFFMLLLLLYRRRNKEMKEQTEQKPKFAPTTPPLATGAGTAGIGIAQTSTTENQQEKIEPIPIPTPTPQTSQPQPRIAQTRYVSASTTSMEMNNPQPSQIDATVLSSQPCKEGIIEDECAQNRTPQDSMSGIESLVKRIQFLKAEKAKMTESLNEIEKIAKAQEKALENEIRTSRVEIEEMKSNFTKSDIDQKAKLNEPQFTNLLTATSTISSRSDYEPQIISRIAKTFEEEVKLMEEGFEYVTGVGDAKIFRRKEVFASKSAKNVEEMRKLIEEGFEYVTEIDGTRIFRKQEKFSLQMARTVEEARILAEKGFDYIGELDGAKVFKK
ncbi:MAG TPA: hypothetical protein VMD05_02555, partial [Candidatus Nanoarchaeia archaeon]|nr:hypothetical protein [Candidatus Nanoarchaeia archaeon]